MQHLPTMHKRFASEEFPGGGEFSMEVETFPSRKDLASLNSH